MVTLLFFLLRLLVSPFRSTSRLEAENAALRRECLDHVLIIGERHLRQMLASYSSYYNESRTHLALEKDAPLRRAIQRCGVIITTPILSGLPRQCLLRLLQQNLGHPVLPGWRGFLFPARSLSALWLWQAGKVVVNVYVGHEAGRHPGAVPRIGDIAGRTRHTGAAAPASVRPAPRKMVMHLAHPIGIEAARAFHIGFH